MENSIQTTSFGPEDLQESDDDIEEVILPVYIFKQGGILAKEINLNEMKGQKIAYIHNRFIISGNVTIIYF